MASNAENVSIWWRHQACSSLEYTLLSLTSPLAHIVYLPTSWPYMWQTGDLVPLIRPGIYMYTSTGIDADASKGETSPGYYNSKLIYSYKCGTIFPWEFPEISLAYSHISLKGPSRSIIYGKIFWPPHPHPHIASPASIYHQNQLSFFFGFPFI